MSERPDFPYQRPIPVEGGLVARSSRGSIGETWWSRRFVGVLESFELGGRLTRGRAYARKGQVISLDVKPGEVDAVVQGSRVTPYRVKIGLAGFSELVWARVEVTLAEQAIFSARLLAGEFPPELEPVFAQVGAPLFPGRLGDLDLRCSCPDQAVPCKHIAAAFYLLAERFDADPFLILQWRGRSREALLARLRQLRGHDPLADPSGPGAGARSEAMGAGGGPGRFVVLSSALVLAEISGPTGSFGVGGSARAAGAAGSEDEAGRALRFWTAGTSLPLPSQPPLPPDLLLRQLPAPGPALGGERLVAQLAPLYERLSDITQSNAGGPEDGNLEP